MFHGDRARLGWNDQEGTLTPVTVAGGGFGALWSSPVLHAALLDDNTIYSPHLYASPLYADDVALSGNGCDGITASVVFAASSNGWVYAVNAFATQAAAPGATVPAGTLLWATRLGTPAPVKNDGGVALGVLSTPILDDRATPPRLYVTAMDAAAGWRAFALDAGSGAVLPGWPVNINEGTVGPVNRNGPALFTEAPILSQRGALNLSPDGKLLYVPFGGYNDKTVGWMIAIDTNRTSDTGGPRVAAAFSGAPASSAEANGGIWAAGGGAVDERGFVHATTGNSPDGAGNAPHVWGNSLLMFSPELALVGTFTPFNYCQLDHADIDLGGSSPVILPDFGAGSTKTPHLVSFGSKQGNVYLVDRDALRGSTERRPPCSTDAATDASLLPPAPQPQFGARGPLNVFGPYSEEFGNVDHSRMRSTPAVYRDAGGAIHLFVSGSTKAAVDSTRNVPPSLARLGVVAGPDSAYLAMEATDHTLSFFNPGSPVVTSRGGENPIVWVLDSNAPRVASLLDAATPHPVLYAVDGETMAPLWRSAAGELGLGGKYSTVAVAHGVVFVGTDRIQAFGLR